MNLDFWKILLPRPGRYPKLWVVEKNWLHMQDCRNLIAVASWHTTICDGPCLQWTEIFVRDHAWQQGSKINCMCAPQVTSTNSSYELHLSSYQCSITQFTTAHSRNCQRDSIYWEPYRYHCGAHAISSCEWAINACNLDFNQLLVLQASRVSSFGPSQKWWWWWGHEEGEREKSGELEMYEDGVWRNNQRQTTPIACCLCPEQRQAVVTCHEQHSNRSAHVVMRSCGSRWIMQDVESGTEGCTENSCCSCTFE